VHEGIHRHGVGSPCRTRNLRDRFFANKLDGQIGCSVDPTCSHDQLPRWTIGRECLDTIDHDSVLDERDLADPSSAREIVWTNRHADRHRSWAGVLNLDHRVFI
jgi:hypothetical protein